MGQLFSSSEKKKSTPVVYGRQYEPPANYSYQPYRETSYNVSRSNSIYSGRHVNQTISNFPHDQRNSVTSVSSIGQSTRTRDLVTSRPIANRYSSATSVSSVGTTPSYERSRPTGYASSSRPSTSRPSTPSNMGHLNSHGRLQVGSYDTNIAPRTRNVQMIKLYHYTPDQNANTIRREKLIRSSTTSTPQKYRQHGCGVYFTSLDPSVDPKRLALNNFTNGGTYVTSGLLRKICHVIEITFYENEVEKIRSGNRNIYLYRGSIDLREYEGRYRIYQNPNY